MPVEIQSDTFRFPEGERQIIVWAIAHPSSVSRLAKDLHAEHFSESLTRTMWKVITEVSPELSVVADAVSQRFPEVNVYSALETWAEGVPEGFDVWAVVQRLIELASKRRVARALQEGLKELSSGREVQEVVGPLLDAIYSLPRKNLIYPEEIPPLREAKLRERELRGFVPTGIRQLDHLLVEGLSPQSISVIAGRPGMGKTSVKRNLIKNLCGRGYGVLSVCLEGGFSREIDGLSSILLRIPLSKVLASKEEDMELLLQCARDISTWKLFIQEGPEVSFLDIVRALEFLHQSESRIDVVFIDLFDRLVEISRSSTEKHAVISRLLMREAEVAQRLTTHFCNLVQIRRLLASGVERTRPHCPTLEDLKDSGGYEEISDLVLLLFREAYYDERMKDDKLDIIIAKQRIGVANKTVRVRVDWSTGEIQGGEDENL